ncbi:MAG: type I DNA topoisomerase [Bacilli bacterium]|nr:type I DNA topoisomerase [Bacilli bacterium]
MSKYLVIVESPSKSKTIEKYLGNDYNVVASMGHIRNLANSGKYGLGIDIENDFKPTYEAIKGKSKVISSLKKDVKDAEYVYLATDPDREGEAISWHLKEALGLKNYSRVEFNEITKPVVIDALKHPRDIDYDLVKSQETRMMLDKIIGFRLSKLMQSKTSGKSAGRVQSVAVKLIVDREREINAFVPEEYWTVTSHFELFDAKLEKYKDEKLEIKTEEEVDKIVSKLSNDYKVKDVKDKEVKNLSKPVFKTSTLQQVAGNKINFTAKKTMSVAQKLYEGINIGSETTGLITYMRTDSERMSPLFINDTFKYIEDTYGKEYVGFVKKLKKNENMQDAHEGIRPTDITRTPESIKSYLSADEYKLYNLIYKRALASLMAPSVSLQTTVLLDNNDYEFKTTGSVIKFDGYLKIYDLDDDEEAKLPKVSVGEVYKTDDVEKKQHFTEPPARFTEASLIKEMESLGIGRPSTYATIVTTIKDRGYVTLDKKKFIPTELGFDTNDKLQEFFGNIINVKYTANMEDDLDEIAVGKLDNIKTLKEFYNEFAPLIDEAFKGMEKTKAKETGSICPNCGSAMVLRKGKYGEFEACSNYPTCKYIKPQERKIVEVCNCPKCDGKIVEKKTKKGKVFYGCNNYPKCDQAYWDMPIGENCPNCNSMLVQKGKKVKCSSCDYER